jgi:5-hydroxyisourate hydrolase-like protein (transthyretin family)
MRALRFLALAVLAGWFASAADRQLTGRVVDANTGEPIARAHVTLRFFQGAQPAQEVTLLSDTDGVFLIANLPGGGYQVSCEKAGYLPASQMMGAMAPANTPDGKNASTVVVKLISQAAVEGTVVDDKDMPAENTFIQLVTQLVVNGRRQFQGAGGGSTDETGYFRIYGLAAGHYYISIAGRLHGARRTKPLAYPPLFYPNATEIAAAQPIDLKAGDELQIKLRLPEPVPAFEVRGVVATVAPNVSVNLVRQGSSPMFQQSSGETSWDAKTRSFKISHVTPGMYQLTAAAQDGRNTMQASTMVSVGNADIAGIGLEPTDTGLDGTVRVEGSSAQLRPMFVNLQGPNFSGGGQVDADGKFHAANLRAETYRVVPQINGQQCVRSILQGGRDARDGVTIAAGIPAAPVDILLTGHCGGIEGTLSLSDSKPTDGLTAVLLRKAGDEFVLEKQAYIGAAGANSSPQFRFQQVTPGDYMLYVWPQGAQIEYANADYMRQVASYGQAVTVIEDGNASVTVDKVLTPAKN